MKPMNLTKGIGLARTVFFGILVGLASLVSAQTYNQVGNNTTVDFDFGPIYRPTATSTANFSNYAYLYLASELSIPNGAVIYRIDWHAENGTGGLLDSNWFRIDMQNTTQTTVSVTGNNWNSEVAGATMVFVDSAYNFAPGGGWINHPLNTPFTYTGGNLKILTDFIRRGTSTAAIDYHFETKTGLAAGIGVTSSARGTAFTAARSNGRPDIRIFYYIANQGSDAGISQILSPSSGVQQGQSVPVTARVANYSGNVITSLQLAYQLENNTVVTENWTGTLNPGTTFDYTFTTNTTMPNFHQSAIRVWITDVNNNGVDDDQTNDSLAKDICLKLTGNYTIGPDTSDDFASILEAVNTMECGNGISGPVQFFVKEGIYTDKIVLNPVDGASATNTVTFKGENPNTTIIEYGTTVSADRVAFSINGAKHIIIDSLGFEVSGSTYGWAIGITTGAENLVIKNNIIRLDTTNTGTNFNGIIGTNSSTAEGTAIQLNGLLIENNTINGGNNGIKLTGASTNRITNVIARNNRISNSYDYGIYLSQTESPTVEKNTINVRSGTGASTTSAGIYFTNVSGSFVISRNKVTNAGQYGIYFISCAGTSGSPAKVTNNLIGGGFRSTVATAGGIYLTGSSAAPTSYIDIYYNSVNFDIGSGAALNFRNANINNVRVMNNSLAYTGSGAGFALYILSAGNVSQLNYNNYFASGTKFVYYTADRANLTTLRAVNNPTGNDVNSIALNPGYANAFDLRLISVNLVGKGTPISGITTDYYGETRSTTTPVIGAHEFVPLPYDAGITALVSPVIVCGTATSEVIKVTVFNYGTEVLTSIPVAYQVNGGSWVTETISTSLAANASLNYSFSATANLSGAGPFVIKLTTGLSNDGRLANDTIAPTIQRGLAGPVYTIGGTSPDYATIGAAVDDLKAKGVCGPIKFEIRPGTYTERNVIPAILGASATNTITFKGAGPSSTIIAHSTTVSANRSAIVLDGAQYIIIDSIGIDATGSTYGWGIHLTNGSSNNIIRNNKIILSPTTTSVNFSGIIASISPTAVTGGNSAHHTLIENNEITGGYTGIGLYGTSAIRLEGMVVNNNTSNGHHYNGIYMSYVSAAIANGNSLTHRTTGNNLGNGLYLLGPGPFSIQRNNIVNGGQNGIMVTTSPLSGSTRSILANNMVGGRFLSASNLASGIRILSSSDVDVYHNTVNMNCADGSALALISTCTNINVKNNIFAYTGEGPGFAARFESPGSLLSNDHNNYYSISSNFVWYGSAVADLAALQAINSPAGNDANSLSLNPYFVSDSDLRLTRINLNGKGTPVSSVSKDYFGTTRSVTAPTIGAHEFVPLALDAGITALLSPTTSCGLTNSESVRVEIFNYGSSVLTSIPVAYRLVGGSVVQETATANLTINDVNNYSFTVPVTLNGNGPFMFEMWTELAGDMLADNDTFRAVVYKTLNGTYTIGSTGDFATFANATEVLKNAGICGPVVFEIQAETFNERVVVSSVAGASAINTITFKGVDPVNSVLRHSTTVSIDRSAFVIDNTEYVTLDSFTIDVTPQGTGTRYGWGIQIKNNASNTTVRNMTILADTNNSSVNYCGIVLSRDTVSVSSGVLNTNNVLIENNHVQGGNYGIVLYGLTSSSNPSMPKPSGYLQGIRIEDNLVTHSYSYGIAAYNTNTAHILGNTIRMRSVNAFQYAMYFNESVGPFRISRNHISNSSAYGLIVWYSSADANDPAYIDNNIIGAGFRENNNAATSGIRLFGATTNPTQNIKIMHNSVNFDANAGAAFQITSAGVQNIDVVNNIFSATGGRNGYAINTDTSGIKAFVRLNNNNYYGNGTNLGRQNAIVVPDLASLRAINIPVGNDTNSLSIKPLFVSGTDLRLTAPDFYQKGTAAPGVPQDYFGKTRDAVTPTIGAEEFIPFDNDMSVQQILSPNQFDCGDSSNTITIVVRNLGLNTQTSIPVRVAVTGTQTVSYSEVIPGPLAFGESDTFSFANTINFVSGGLVDVAVYTELPSDDNLDNDTLRITSLINPKGVNPVVFNDTICQGANAALVANAGSGTRIWFETADAILPFLTDADTLKLNTVLNEESYFVENVSKSTITYHVGAVDNSIGTTSTAFFSDAQIFDAYTNLYIDSVKLIVDVAGTITMGLLDAAGNVIATKQATLTQGTSYYHLGFYVPPGTGYRLSMRSSSTGVRLFRNTAGANYPYVVPGLMSMTGTTFTNQAYYYFFYDLKVQSYCPSERLEVKVVVSELPDIAAIRPDANFQGEFAVGGVPNIDHACAGDTLVYQLDAPYPYTNANYGDRWEISSVDVQTSNGTSIGSPVFAAPINGKDASFSVLSTPLDGDSIFIVTLTYNLAEGCSTSLVRYIYVSPKPQASFSVADVCAGDSIRITNTSSMQGNPQISYTWEFGDLSGSTATSPSHLYGAAGTYEITLVAAAQVGCPDTVRTTVNVFELPQASFDVADSVCGNVAVQFANTSSALPSAQFEWNFGDGNTVTDNSPSHNYATDGSYTVWLKVIQNGCADSTSKELEIISVPLAAFSAYSVCLGDSILFTNQSTNASSALTYTWSFGDAAMSSQTSPVHTYQNSGVYPVQLIATNSFGCEDTVSSNVEVYALPNSTFTPNYLDNGLVQFTANQGGAPVYVWNFGDASTGSGAVVNHQYLTNGTFVVSLKVTSDEGCVDSSNQNIQTVNVSIGDILNATQGFEVYPNPFSQNTQIHYNLNGNAHVSLSVYDVSGKLIQAIANEGQSAGKHSYTFDSEDKSGVYLVKLMIDGRVYTTRIVKVN